MEKQEKEIAVYFGAASIRITDQSFGRCELGFVRIEDPRTPILRAPGSYSPYDNLVVNCQWTVDRPTETTYGWDARYRDVFAVDHQDCERMRRMFKKLAKAEGRFAFRPQSFGQYVVMLAAGLGIKRMFKDVTENRRSCGFDDGDYREYAIKDAAAVIDHAIAEAHKPVEVQS